MTRPASTAGLSDDLQRTTYSFRKLNASEADRIRPYRIAIYDVQPGDSVSSIARKMAIGDRQLDRFLVLNGLDRNSVLQPGERVKIVAR